MRYTSRSRDRYRTVLSLLTGLATFGTVAASGAATGLAARHTAARDRERAEAAGFAQAQARAAAARAAVWQPSGRTIRVTKVRAARTVVVTRVVHAVSGPGVTAVGAGGSVTASAPPQSAPASSGTTRTSTSSGPPPAPAPQPAPAPAPSSGS